MSDLTWESFRGMARAYRRTLEIIAEEDGTPEIVNSPLLITSAWLYRIGVAPAFDPYSANDNSLRTVD